MRGQLRVLGLAGVVILVLAGCATAPAMTPAERSRVEASNRDCVKHLEASKSIRITGNPEVVKGCAFLGNVQGRTWTETGFVSNSPRQEDRCIFAGAAGAVHLSADVARFQAAKLGADVVLTPSTGDEFTGEAYRCQK